MSSLPLNVLYYGQEQPLPEQRLLRAGPLTLLLEEGDLRYIRLGSSEILRRVYVAIRDRNWGTVAPVLSDVRIEASGETFHITYNAEHKQGEIDFFWKATIDGQRDGRITFTMAGEARSTFWRNRIGFCILHPIRECAGCPCTVEHVDGTVEEGWFPEWIAPHAPFKDMQAISHRVTPDLWAEVRFAGDTFEMEDQRNWTDASYKTFCTPLALSYPVRVPQGARVFQSVTLTLKGTLPAVPTEPARRRLTYCFREGLGRSLPRIGLGMASHDQLPSEAEFKRLGALNLAHLRVDLRLDMREFSDRLRNAHACAQRLGVPLEAALFVPDNIAALEKLVAVLEQTRPCVKTWLVLPLKERVTTRACLRTARAALRSFDPHAQIGVGTDADFVDLNRQPPWLGQLEWVCYPMNPQVHAFDNASLVETLAAQAATVAGAQRLFPSLLLAITPVTLKRRWNPDATGPVLQPAPGELPAQVDVRQMSLFGAGWTVGSVKYLAESGVPSVTYYETTGWRGVMETEAGCPLPAQFRSWPGCVFPMYHVFADLGAFAAGQVLPTLSSDPLRGDGLAVQYGGKTRILFANLGPEVLEVTFTGLGAAAEVKYLDETNAEAAMRAPEEFREQPGVPCATATGPLELTLRPYAIARIDTHPD